MGDTERRQLSTSQRGRPGTDPSLMALRRNQSWFLGLPAFRTVRKEVSMFFFLIYKFIYLFVCLFLAALVLRCCSQAFSSCSERGLLFAAVRGLLTAVASLVAEHGLQAHRLQ